MRQEDVNMPTTSWAENEFGMVDFGDKRLNKRLIKIANSLANAPESSINQASKDWHQTKAAYRFFQNDAVSQSKMLDSHIKQTIQRAQRYPVILAIQDTCYISYKDHHKTQGLAMIAAKTSARTTHEKSYGLVMHTTFGVTPQGLPVGLLDQKISARTEVELSSKKLENKNHPRDLPIEEKESIRWLESLKKYTSYAGLKNVQVVTLCDREGDIYDLFEVACSNQSPFVIRAAQNRKVNKKSIYSQNSGEKLWDLLSNSPSQGEITVNIPACCNKPARKTVLAVRFSHFKMNRPQKSFNDKSNKLTDLKLNAIYVKEETPSAGAEPLEWMLLTNMEVFSFAQAVEKIKWYCLRWRIETFHKILKSGLKVEECRLGRADKLIRFLTVVSVIAWRIFYITLIGRSNPDLPCTYLLAEEEWKVLYSKIHATKDYPTTPPTIREAIRWIAQLGGFLARKNDGEPGPIALWKGWKRLVDITQGWELALT